MKPLSEYVPFYKPLYEGSRISNFVKGKQFFIYRPDGSKAGFMTQHSNSHFNAHIDGKVHNYYNIVDFRRFLSSPEFQGYLYRDTINAG